MMVGPEQRRSQQVMSVSSVRRILLGILLLLSWTSVLPAAAAIVREPYLQQATPTSITIVWQTDLNSASNSRVQFGTVAGNLNQTALGVAVIPPSNSAVKNHEVRINGLSPAKKYFYNVGTVTNGVQGGGTVNHFFVTAPTVGSVTPFRAWVVGDSGNGSANQIAVRDAMLTQSTAPDLFLHMGDIAYDNGTDAEFTTNHFAIYQDILRHTSSWPTLGNHEAPNSPMAGVGPYYEAHVLPTGSSGTEAYYSFDYANVHFIVLDSMSSGREVTDPMLQWLVTDLGSTSQEWVIAYFHHPPYTKGTHNSDNATDSGGRMTDMREKALSILEAGGVDLVLAGHSHLYERSFLLDQAYGFGTSPNFVTPDYSTLLGSGRILDPGDGDPSGDGVYQKNSGGNSNNGAVYVVAGHGGKSIGSSFGGAHPVMVSVDEQFGSVLLDVNGNTLTVRNLRATETISDTFSIQKIPNGVNVPPSGVIDTPVNNQTITVGAAINFTGTGTDPNNNLPLTHLWNFGAGSGIPNSTKGDPGSVTFNTVGVYTVTYTVKDALGLADATPATIKITVSPAGGGGTTGWTADAQNPTGIWRDSGFDNRTFRTLLKGSAITAGGSPVQVTFRGRTSGSYTLENLSLVPREGTTLNGAGPLQPVTFNGGATSVTVPAGGTVTSDPIAFTLAPGQDVFLTFWVPPGSSGVYRDGGTETAAWYVNGTNVSGVLDWTPLTISGTKAHVYDAVLVVVQNAG